MTKMGDIVVSKGRGDSVYRLCYVLCIQMRDCMTDEIFMHVDWTLTTAALSHSI